MKLKLLNEFGIPFNLTGISSIKVLLPYYDGKTLTKNKVDILEAGIGMIQIELSEFERDGMPEGKEITFWAHVVKGDTEYTFEFTKELNVKLQDGIKVIQ